MFERLAEVREMKFKLHDYGRSFQKEPLFTGEHELMLLLKQSHLTYLYSKV